jgi:RNA polymerase sigma-70 factor, ECF subfamily
LESIVDNDRDLTDVRRVLEGDLSAFENIVRRWQAPLINLAYRFCRDRQRAEDMAQEAFLHIYRKLNKFSGTSAFSTWIFATGLNLYRSSMRRKSLQVESLDEQTEITFGYKPQLRLEQDEREELLRKAVTVLPPRYRDAVIIFYFREMDLTETAAILGVPEGIVKAWLHRGRELFRRKLDSYDKISLSVKEAPL